MRNNKAQSTLMITIMLIALFFMAIFNGKYVIKKPNS